MKYLLFIVLCLSTLVLGGCGLLVWYIAGDTAHNTKCEVDDSETNRQQVMQVVRLIADRYGFQDRTEEDKARDEQWGSASLKASGYTILAGYYAPGRGKTSDEIRLSVSAQGGEVHVSLSQTKQGKATQKYIEIQNRLISELRERYGAAVEVDVSDYRI